MNESGPALVLTRTIALPFAPHPELTIAGRDLDHSPDPLGFRLKELTWDVDRRTFLAHSEIVSAGEIAEIPDEISEWLRLGWKLGSYLDAYRGATPAATPQAGGWAIDADRHGRHGIGSRTSKHRRWRKPKDKVVFRAMVRKLVEIRNNLPVAYAMYKTKCFVDNHEEERSGNVAVRRFREAQDTFASLSSVQEEAWRRRVLRSYPTLESLVRVD
jgi:hypothetical protein